MKAVRIHAYGDASVLAYEDAPVPKISAVEVLVRVVEAVGDDVTRFKLGDAVYSRPDIKRNGTYAEIKRRRNCPQTEDGVPCGGLLTAICGHLKDLSKAHAFSETGRAVGKIVLYVGKP